MRPVSSSPRTTVTSLAERARSLWPRTSFWQAVRGVFFAAATAAAGVAGDDRASPSRQAAASARQPCEIHARYNGAPARGLRDTRVRGQSPSGQSYVAGTGSGSCASVP